jgi:hypothetical protein
MHNTAQLFLSEQTVVRKSLACKTESLAQTRTNPSTDEHTQKKKKKKVVEEKKKKKKKKKNGEMVRRNQTQSWGEHRNQIQELHQFMLTDAHCTRRNPLVAFVVSGNMEKKKKKKKKKKRKKTNKAGAAEVQSATRTTEQSKRSQQRSKSG